MKVGRCNFSVSMRLGSYNIRGIGGQAKKIEVQQLVREQKLDLLCLQESKVEIIERVRCATLWDDDDFGRCFKASEGRSGGLIILWRK